jgi:biotin carboxyl carrier protein
METRRLKIACGDQTVDVRLEGDEAFLGDRRVRLRVHRRGNEIEAIEVDGKIHQVRAVRDAARVLVWCGGRVFEFRSATGATARPSETTGDLVSPMPGRVRQLLVAVGDSITRGQVVLVLEAMKMEHALRSPRDGVVTAIAHGEGELVEAGVLLAEIV